jgi:hypothetical protein
MSQTGIFFLLDGDAKRLVQEKWDSAPNKQPFICEKFYSLIMLPGMGDKRAAFCQTLLGMDVYVVAKNAEIREKIKCEMAKKAKK